jgi:hypothetical protein
MQRNMLHISCLMGLQFGYSTVTQSFSLDPLTRGRIRSAGHRLPPEYYSFPIGNIVSAHAPHRRSQKWSPGLSTARCLRPAPAAMPER